MAPSHINNRIAQRMLCDDVGTVTVSNNLIIVQLFPLRSPFLLLVYAIWYMIPRLMYSDL
jgi:hypothetical protein